MSVDQMDWDLNVPGNILMFMLKNKSEVGHAATVWIQLVRMGTGCSTKAICYEDKREGNSQRMEVNVYNDANSKPIHPVKVKFEPFGQ